MRYTMTEKQAGESGLNCGGSVRIYTEVIEPDGGADFYGRVLAARQARSGCALATLLKSRFDASGEGRLWLGADGSIYGSLGTSEADLQVEEHLPEVLERERGLVCALDPGAKLGETCGSIYRAVLARACALRLWRRPRGRADLRAGQERGFPRRPY